MFRDCGGIHFSYDRATQLGTTVLSNMTATRTGAWPVRTLKSDVI